MHVVKPRAEQFGNSAEDRKTAREECSVSETSWLVVLLSERMSSPSLPIHQGPGTPRKTKAAPAREQMEKTIQGPQVMQSSDEESEEKGEQEAEESEEKGEQEH